MFTFHFELQNIYLSRDRTEKQYWKGWELDGNLQLKWNCIVHVKLWMHVHTETELDIDDSSSRAYPRQFLLYVKVYLFPIFASYYTEEWMKTSMTEWFWISATKL